VDSLTPLRTQKIIYLNLDDAKLSAPKHPSQCVLILLVKVNRKAEEAWELIRAVLTQQCVGILTLALRDPHEDYAGAVLRLGTSPAFAVELRKPTNIPSSYL
jgi:hypothetical protein